MWGRRRRNRQRLWPEPAEVDAAIEARRASGSTEPTEPTTDEVVELAELLLLRGLRDLEVRRPGPAALDLREATELLDIAGTTSQDDVSRVRVAWIALARCEAILGNVTETVAALDRLREIPAPRLPSEHRAMVAMLEHPLRLRGRLHAGHRPADSEQVRRALLALLDRLATSDEATYGRLRDAVAREPEEPAPPAAPDQDGPGPGFVDS